MIANKESLVAGLDVSHSLTVNPKTNLAHCFSCGENTNNIDLMMLCGHDFVPVVTILKGWLEQYRRDLDESLAASSSSSR